MEAELARRRSLAEANRAPRLTMRAHGLKIDGATNVMRDNQAAVSQVTKHDALSKKRHVAISWARMRESVRCGEMGVMYCPTAYRLADILIRRCGPITFNRLVAMMMHRVRVIDVDNERRVG